MEEISPTHVAFTGFRTIRAHPSVLIFWSLLYILAACVFLGLLLSLGGGLGSLGADPTPEAFLALLPTLAPLGGLALVGSWIFYGVMAAAANRAVLRPRESAFGYLRFGMDEIRQIVVQIAFGLLSTMVMILIVLAFVLLGAVLAERSPIGFGLSIFFGLSLSLCGAVFLAVKFSLASAQTFDQRRINLFGSWSLTRGHFWTILGAYLLALIMFFLVSLVGSVVTWAVGLMTGGGLGAFGMGVGGPSNPFANGELTLAKILSLGVIVDLVLSCALQSVTQLIMQTPPPAVYRALNPLSDAAEVF